MDSKKMRLLLESEGKKMLVYHTDLDGACSAALILKFFRGFEAVPREGPFLDERFMRQLLAKRPDLLVFVDIPIDQEWEKIRMLGEHLPGMNLVIIDHHIPEKNMNSERIIHMNPRFKKNVYIPAACMVYRLIENLGFPVKPCIWIAAMGVIGDYGLEDCADLFDECRKAFPGSIGDDPLKSRLRDVSEYIMAACILHDIRGIEKSVEMLLASDNYDAVPENSYFSSCREKVDRETARILRDFDKKRRESVELGLYIYRIDSRLNISSTISSLISERNPDKIIIITKHTGYFVKVSARYQKGDISLNELMKHASEGIGSGGGHEKAAGAMVNRKDYEEFEKRLIRRVAELKTV